MKTNSLSSAVVEEMSGMERSLTLTARHAMHAPVIRHILGKANDDADCLSRMFFLKAVLVDGCGCRGCTPLE